MTNPNAIACSAGPGIATGKRTGDIAKGEFDKILKQAVALSRGDGLSSDEAEAQRDTLIEGYR